MRLKLQYQGVRFGLFVVELDNGEVPAHDFMAKLKARDEASHKRMVKVYERHANHGAWTTKRVSRPIETSDGIWEWKTPQGARLLYFYLPGFRTILADGLQKGEQLKPVVLRAENMKRALEE